MRKHIPERGVSWADIERHLVTAKDGDVDWRHGRLPHYIWCTDEAVIEVQRKAYETYFTENALGARRAFPSVQGLEDDVIAMTLSLFNAGEEAAGTFTSGGTESIFLAVKSARDWARARKQIRSPRIIAAQTVHPAFVKAAHCMDVEILRVPPDSEGRAAVDAMRSAINADTAMLIGSAPNFAAGTFDPIEALGELALQHDLWLHVDACVGGFVAPFAARAGYHIPSFDLKVRGVTSLSADIHKYGCGAKGASVLMFRSRELQQHQLFEVSWPRGIYSTLTLLGARPAGPVAAAWAVLHNLGIEGYTRRAAAIMETTRRLAKGIDAIDGLHCLEPRELCILTYVSCSDDLDINAVAVGMSDRGWLIGRSGFPRPSIQMAVIAEHEHIVEDYLADLRVVAAAARRELRTSAFDDRSY